MLRLPSLTAKPAHVWTFFRAGGFDQVSLTTAADISSIGSLDLKLWAALACPVKGLEFDERTLELIDIDHDKRVRAPEVIAAVQYADDHLKDLAAIMAGTDQVAVANIDDSTPSGKAILSCAGHILATQGKSGTSHLCLADVDKAREAFAKTPFNGDGVITPTAAGDDAGTKQAILDIIATQGGITDRDGQSGIDKKRLETFAVDAAAFDGWWAVAEADPAVLHLGDGTLAALTTLDAVRAKIDDWFARGGLAAYDGRAQAALNRQEKDYLDIAGRDLAITAEEIRGFPLSKVEPGRPLPLSGALNPYWTAAIASFRTKAVQPILGAGTEDLAESDWIALQARFAATRAWLAKRSGGSVEALGLARVRALRASDFVTRIEALLARDLAFATEFDSITPVEKLVRMHRDLYRLLHNFVNFADFYSPLRMAIFQAGILYLDSRATELVVRVDDVGKHGILASLSKTYLAYCDCTRPGGEKLTIAAAFTAGDSDHLLVGRNGVLYDRKGRDWDATITRVVENPISIRQAFWAPYKRAIRFVEEMIAKRAAAADEAANTRLATGITDTAAAASTGKAPVAKPKLDIGVIAAIGVAVGGISAAISGFALAFFSLGKWMPLGVAGVILAISGPSMIIAWLKLRQRNLGPILDANGWAVNGRVKINIPFGGSLTQLACLPEGSARSLRDPYAEKKQPWLLYTILIVLLLAGGWLGYDRVRNGMWLWQRIELEAKAREAALEAKVEHAGDAPAAAPAK